VVTVADLPARAEAGLFVASPPAVRIAQFHSHSLSVRDPTLGRASFDHVTVAAAGPAASDWHDSDVTPSPPSHEPRAVAGQPGAGDRPLYVEIVPGGSAPDRDGTITVTGSGDIGRVGMGGITLADMDRVTASLVGVRLGLIGAVALGVLSMTSEFKTGMIATTFAASPNRGAVLAAKAVAVAVVVFVTGLGASLAAFFAALALQRGNGYRPPVYPEPSMTDPAVLRAIIGTAAFLALIALFSLAIGALVRRTAGAVIVLFALLVVIPTVVAGISASADTWIRRTTPVAGLSIQQTMTFPPGSSEVVTGTWTGFAVLCGYVLVALAAAFGVLRKRDV
jgi:ABC-type transport system involved in multi-copper enzyme maturation permease subunit